MRRFDPDPVAYGPSVLQATDARTRLISAIFLLAGISLAHDRTSFAILAAVVVLSLTLARIRPRPFLVRALAVTALPLTFVVLNYLLGDKHRALLLLTRACLSAGVLIVFTAVTTLPEVSSALARLGAPQVLTETIHLLYRYLFVLTDQALRMRDAVSCRGGSGSMLAAGGSVGVLFARSYSRAEGVHRAMLSRGYTGTLPSHDAPGTGTADWIMLTLCAAAAFGRMVWNAVV